MTNEYRNYWKAIDNIQNDETQSVYIKKLDLQIRLETLEQLRRIADAQVCRAVASETGVPQF